jgi:MFS family permease
MRPRLLELATLGAYLPASAIPALAAERGWDPGLLVVPFCAAFALSFPLWGRVADRRERRVVIAGGLLLLAGAGAVVAAAGSPLVAGIGRGLEGLAAAAIPPAAQAELTRGSGDGRAGRAIGGMMIAVALATLGGPILATALLDSGAGWGGTVALLAVVVPAACAAAVVLLAGGAKALKPAAPPLEPAASALQPAASMLQPAASPRAPLDVNRGLAAGWLVSMLVLAGYWTVLTRLGVALGEDGLDAPKGLQLAAPLVGALGIPLVVIAARSCDRFGPRAPMVVTLAVGAAGFTAAAAAPSAAAFAACAGIGLAAYWAYLPVVSVQVQRSAPAAARGRAVGWLYAAMWSGAAVAGAAGSLAGSWRAVLAGAGLSWALALLVASKSFLSRPAVPSSSSPWRSRLQRLAIRPSTR